tara:strand:+ start:23049 stop:24257 length:1209 start_codon:yes stop_codon:yes gene_type:complete
MTGTASIQLMNFLITPIITRLYSPEALGALGLFTSIIGLIVVVAVFSYPAAIVIVKSDRAAENLINACIKIMSLACVCVIFSIFIFYLIQLNEINYIPLFILLAAYPACINSIYTQAVIRKRQFKALAFITFISALAVAVFKVLLGVLKPSSESLLLSATIGFFLSSYLMHISLKRENLPISFTKLSIKENYFLRKYSRFPKYRMPQALNASLSQIIPISLLSYFFGIAEAGYFSLTRSVMMVPVSIMGKAVFDVTYPKLSQDFSEKPIFKFLVLSSVVLIVISALPILTLFIWGEELFILVFGLDWKQSGVYASCMSMWFLFGIANRTCLAAIPLLHLDKFQLKNSVVNLILSTFAFLFSFYIWESDTKAIFSFFSVATLAQLVLIIKVLTTARSSDLRLF